MIEKRTVKRKEARKKKIVKEVGFKFLKLNQMLKF